MTVGGGVKHASKESIFLSLGILGSLDVDNVTFGKLSVVVTFLETFFALGGGFSFSGDFSRSITFSFFLADISLCTESIKKLAVSP